MYNNKIIAILILFFIMAPSNLTAEEYCLPEKIVGKIISINKKNLKDVLLYRNGKSLAPNVGDCIEYEDRIKTVKKCQVIIQTGHDRKIIGYEEKSDSWNAPKAQSDSVLMKDDNILKEFFNICFKSNEYTKPAISRGSGCTEFSNYTTAVEPISNMPPGKQIIGSDLTKLFIAWRANTGIEYTRIKLIDKNANQTIYNSRECWVTSHLIPLPKDRIHPGDKLVLSLSDSSKQNVEWTIEVVSPYQLPSPSISNITQSMLGFWRLFHGNVNYRLDSISRISLNDSDLAAPGWILGPFISDSIFFRKNENEF